MVVQMVPSVCQMSAVYSHVFGWHRTEYSASSALFMWQVVSVDWLVVITYKAQMPVLFENGSNLCIRS